MCAGVDPCTIGNIFVSLALFGEGDVMSIVSFGKMCNRRNFPFFLFNLTLFFLFVFSLFFLLSTFIFYFLHHI